MDCNCSICSRKGTRRWFVPRETLQLLVPEADPGTCTFGLHTVRHRFCMTGGIHPFGAGADPAGKRMAAINVRRPEDVDLSSLPVTRSDGRSF